MAHSPAFRWMILKMLPSVKHMGAHLEFGEKHLKARISGLTELNLKFGVFILNTHLPNSIPTVRYGGGSTMLWKRVLQQLGNRDSSWLREMWLEQSRETHDTKYHLYTIMNVKYHDQSWGQWCGMSDADQTEPNQESKRDQKMGVHWWSI